MAKHGCLAGIKTRKIVQMKTLDQIEARTPIRPVPEPLQYR
jgi:hypothetical protein